MPQHIEDYALISDCRSAALLGRDGSIDWLCLPRYDSPSTFGALLGTEHQGRWLLAPRDAAASCERSYLRDSFILRTVWTTPTGTVEVLDFMPHGNARADVVRRVHGLTGSVQMHQDLRIRFGYAAAMPWVRQLGGESEHAILAVAGPDAVVVRGPALHADGRRHRSEFSVAAGETVDVQLTWHPAHRPTPAGIDVDAALRNTQRWWQDWSERCRHTGAYREHVVRSLLVLRALPHEETGGIVAAATTSLPEQVGGTRNWDYRYVWLRDAALTLDVLLSHGYEDEAEEWRAWLLRALAGDPGDVQIMYGLSGERELPERELTSLPGYRGAAPVRVGNGAVNQFQSDVVGEVMVALHTARTAGVRETEYSWPLQRALMTFLEENWRRPDQGIWEMRGPARHFTHSRVMVWAAFDRAVRGITEFGLPGPLEHWRTLRDEIRRDIDQHGVHARGFFTQTFGGTEVDAALLVLPQVGFCSPTDPRMLATVAEVESRLLRSGLLLRYRTDADTLDDTDADDPSGADRAGVDGLTPGEHPFLACSFWLVEQYALSNRRPDADALMRRLMGCATDLGLISEEYDVTTGHQMGNTPQALSHLALVRAADALAAGPAGSGQAF